MRGHPKPSRTGLRSYSQAQSHASRDEPLSQKPHPSQDDAPILAAYWMIVPHYGSITAPLSRQLERSVGESDHAKSANRWNYRLPDTVGRRIRRLGDETTSARASPDRRHKKPCLGIHGGSCHGFGAGAWESMQSILATCGLCMAGFYRSTPVHALCDNWTMRHTSLTSIVVATGHSRMD